MIDLQRETRALVASLRDHGVDAYLREDITGFVPLTGVQGMAYCVEPGERPTRCVLVHHGDGFLFAAFWCGALYEVGEFDDLTAFTRDCLERQRGVVPHDTLLSDYHMQACFDFQFVRPANLQASTPDRAYWDRTPNGLLYHLHEGGFRLKRNDDNQRFELHYDGATAWTRFAFGLEAAHDRFTVMTPDHPIDDPATASLLNTIAEVLQWHLHDPRRNATEA